MAIHFFYENITFNLEESLTKNWIQNTIKSENYSVGDINIIITNDSYIISINQNYLQRDYPTDVISFPLSDSYYISGDIFISLDTIKNNAIFYQGSIVNELMRVIIHGVLHLMGYKDYTSSEKENMRKKEDEHLRRLNQIRPPT